MPDRSVDVLLIGGGVASATAAQELVSGGFDGSALLVGRELDPPYDRPPITKEYLRGEQEREASHRPESGWFDTAPVELLTRTSVMKLDTAAREATLSTKETVGYEHALVATGSMVRRLQVDGTQLDGIHYLRAFGNADAIRAELDERRARRLRRRVLHRLRGRGFADGARQARDDRDARGRADGPRLR